MRLEEARAAGSAKIRPMSFYPWTPELDHLLIECYGELGPKHTSVYDTVVLFRKRAEVQWPVRIIERHLAAVLAELKAEALGNARRARMRAELERRRVEAPSPVEDSPARPGLLPKVRASLSWSHD